MGIDDVYDNGPKKIILILASIMNGLDSNTKVTIS